MRLEDLFKARAGTIILRQYEGYPPEVFRKTHGGFWIELADDDTADFYREASGVVWSAHATFTVVWAPEEAE
ncbi:hypothetical protein [Agromyces larvae]|uniref:Uncharacterized protein n=1 Tax=Agromyces larvae TaxID=2929802 RepID=A0ABY4C3A2_9MICO|nr:hypothetical protein [Agromyces larvae]UOE45922.1 hypothetical protein MTO99_09335 [Agromyces larvae]